MIEKEIDSRSNKNPCVLFKDRASFFEKLRNQSIADHGGPTYKSGLHK